MANIGKAIINLFFKGLWSRLIASAMVRRALLNAVSPDVMGQAITPRIARIPPAGPSKPNDTFFTTRAAPLQ